MKKFLDYISLFADILIITGVYYTVLVYSNYYVVDSFTGFISNRDFLLFLIVIILTLSSKKIYTLRYDFWEETRHITTALFFSFFIILSITVLQDELKENFRLFIVLFFCSLLVFLPLFKRIFKRVIYSFDIFKKRVKIIGNISQKELLTKEFESNWYLGFRVVSRKAEAIYIVTRGMKKNILQRYLRRYYQKIEEIYILPYLENISFSDSKILELFNVKISLIKLENNLLKRENILLKEVFEKLLVISSLPFFLVIHSIISLLIKRDSEGSVLFVQERLGKDGKIFDCYKYRTMVTTDQESILKKYLQKNPQEIEYYEKYHKYENDPRITKIGRILRKTSLDELPQLINVLKGEMSLIGPRPYLPSERDKLKSDIVTILRVKPGISGLWQVSGRNNLSFSKRKELDIWYIQNWSLWMDIVILLKTLKVVFLKTGAK